MFFPFVCDIWWPSLTPGYLNGASLSNSCIVVSRSMFMLSVFFGLPCTNVHLAHLVWQNYIWMSSEYRFTNLSCSVNFSFFGAKSFKSLMSSGCFTFLSLWMFSYWMLGVYRCPCSLMRLLSGSRARQKRRGESLSPWKIPCHIFTHGISIFPSEGCNINVVFQSPIAFSISLINWGSSWTIHAVDNLVILVLQFLSMALFSKVIGGLLYGSILFYIHSVLCWGLHVVSGGGISCDDSCKKFVCCW